MILYIHIVLYVYMLSAIVGWQIHLPSSTVRRGIWILFTVTSSIYLFVAALPCHTSSHSVSHPVSHTVSHGVSHGLSQACPVRETGWPPEVFVRRCFFVWIFFVYIYIFIYLLSIYLYIYLHISIYIYMCVYIYNYTCIIPGYFFNSAVYVQTR